MTPAVLTSTATDPTRLLTDLSAARLLSADRGARLLAEFKQLRGHGSFLDHLLASGVLTAYQVERVSAGQAASLVLGPYQLQEPVGSGSLGAVYLAAHRGDRRRVVVKVLPLRSLWNVLQAKKQVQTLAGLPPHPAVVPLIDIDTAGQQHFLAWPFVEGETFESLVHRTGPLPPAQAARLLAEVADGLATLHAHGIAHGLLKPSNLLLGSDGRPRLLDVGMGAILAENIAADESMLDTIAQASSAVSGFDYAAPETILDPHVRTPAADVYAFGCVMHYLLTASPPFPDGNAVDKMLAHQTQPPPSVQQVSPLVPDALADLVVRVMQKSPADRPTDLPAVRVALLAAADEKPAGSGPVRTVVAARPPTLWDAEAPTDPPRSIPAGPVTLPDFDSQPLSVALSLLKSKLANPTQGTPSAVDFDLPDEDAPPPGLPGLIDTVPPGMIARLTAAERDAAVEPHPSATLRESIARTASMPPKSPQTPEPTPVPRAAPLAPAVAWGRSRVHAPPSSRRVCASPTARATPRRFGRLTTAASDFFDRLGRLARQLLPRVFGSPPMDLQVSVFGPRHLEPGKTVCLQVYAHLVDACASVHTLNRALQPDSDLLADLSLPRPVKRGEEIGLHLSLRNGVLSRSLAVFPWHGKPTSEPFELLVPWESPAGRTSAVLTVGLNKIKAGKVAFDLTVLPRAS